MARQVIERPADDIRQFLELLTRLLNENFDHLDGQGSHLVALFKRIEDRLIELEDVVNADTVPEHDHTGEDEGDSITHNSLSTIGVDDHHPQVHGNSGHNPTMTERVDFDAHLNDTVDAHDASAISILDTAADFTATDVEGALAELQADAEADDAALAAHLADTADAHDASAISVLDAAAQFTATDVEAALAEVLDALQAHEADAADAHDASAISILDTAGDFTATDVEGALAELQADAEAHVALENPHGAELDDLTDVAAAAPNDGDVLTFDTVNGWQPEAPGAGAHPDLAAHDTLGLATQAELDAHINDVADAHDASAISYAGGTGMSATDVEAAIDELATEKSDTTHSHTVPTGTMTEQAYSATETGLSATGDSQAVINLGSATGLAGVYLEYAIQIVGPSNTNAAITVELHDPAHNVLESYVYNSAATGAGDDFDAVLALWAKDTTPAAGDYHLNVTAIGVGGGTVTVKQRRVVGVAS